MKNTSQLDRDIWDEYYGRWDILSSAFDLSEFDVRDSSKQTLTETIGTQKMRKGQGFFRNAVLSAYDMTCCITGISCLPLLRASHILPWSKSEIDRLNPSNGLCLNCLHDAAFDRGLFTLTDRHELLLAPRLSDEMPTTVFIEYFGKYEGKPIHLPERFSPQPDYLEYHRDNIFVA